MVSVCLPHVISSCLPTLLYRADELDVLTRTAKGGDAAQEIRKLEDSLKRLRRSFQEAKDLATGAEEAAAKCQVGARYIAVATRAASGFVCTRDRVLSPATCYSALQEMLPLAGTFLRRSRG